jgi:hypothetical protein
MSMCISVVFLVIREQGQWPSEDRTWSRYSELSPRSAPVDGESAAQNIFALLMRGLACFRIISDLCSKRNKKCPADHTSEILRCH